MPTEQCYRDIGALGARLDEIEKARVERETNATRDRQMRDDQIDSRFDEMDKKLDRLIATHNRAEGAVWAIRLAGGGLLAGLFYLLTNGVPDWIKRMLH